MSELSESNGGGGGIRTRDGVASILLFESSAFNHSATPPEQSVIYLDTVVEIVVSLQ